MWVWVCAFIHETAAVKLELMDSIFAVSTWSQLKAYIGHNVRSLFQKLPPFHILHPHSHGLQKVAPEEVELEAGADEVA